MDHVDIDGRSIAYRRRGSMAPTTVLITGSGCDHRYLDTIFDALPEGASVVTYDRSGYGESGPAPEVGGADAGLRWRTHELHGLLLAIGAAPPFILVGHSLGALIAQLFAIDQPDDVLGIVSIDGDDGIPTDLPSWPEFPPDVEREAMAHVLRNKPSSVASPVPPPPEHLVALVVESNDRDAGFERLAAAKASGRLPDVRFVHLGATDHFFGPAELLPIDTETIKARLRDKHARTAAAYRQGTFVEAAESGHYVQYDEPDLVLDAIESIRASSRPTGP